MTAANVARREPLQTRPMAVRNYDAIDRHGATPFIAFKSNHTGRVKTAPTLSLLKSL